MHNHCPHSQHCIGFPHERRVRRAIQRAANLTFSMTTSSSLRLTINLSVLATSNGHSGHNMRLGSTSSKKTVSVSGASSPQRTGVMILFSMMIGGFVINPMALSTPASLWCLRYCSSSLSGRSFPALIDCSQTHRCHTVCRSIQSRHGYPVRCQSCFMSFPHL
jgi:hypothetical protein